VGGPSCVFPHGSSAAEAAERIKELSAAPPPAVITGSSDGKLRLFASNSAQLQGFIAVERRADPANKTNTNSSSSTNNSDAVRNLHSAPPHDGLVLSLVLDQRSRYLVSGDSCGDVLLWRCDARGWPQLLRRLRRDWGAPGQGPSQPQGGVLSLAMHPDKSQGQLLVLSRDPPELKLLSMSNYRPLLRCKGLRGLDSLHRASFSPDGRLLLCGARAGTDRFRLQVWDARTGLPLRCPLSELLFPFPIRCITWHPRQHLLALAAVGEQAAVGLYCTDKESADQVADRGLSDANGVIDAASSHPAASQGTDL